MLLTFSKRLIIVDKEKEHKTIPSPSFKSGDGAARAARSPVGGVEVRPPLDRPTQECFSEADRGQKCASNFAKRGTSLSFP